MNQPALANAVLGEPADALFGVSDPRLNHVLDA
jgi:hypothetical protein